MAITGSSRQYGDEEYNTKLAIAAFRLLSYSSLEGTAYMITVLINTTLWQYIFIPRYGLCSTFLAVSGLDSAFGHLSLHKFVCLVNTY